MSPREATHYPAPYWSFGRHKMVEMVHVVFCVALLVLVAMLCEVGGGWGEGVETERLKKRERERENERACTTVIYKDIYCSSSSFWDSRSTKGDLV